MRCKTLLHKSLLQFYGVTGLLRYPDRGDAHWVCKGLHPRDERTKPGEAPQDAPHDVLGRRDAVGGTPSLCQEPSETDAGTSTLVGNAPLSVQNRTNLPDTLSWGLLRCPGRPPPRGLSTGANDAGEFSTSIRVDSPLDSSSIRVDLKQVSAVRGKLRQRTVSLLTLNVLWPVLPGNDLKSGGPQMAA